MGEQMEKGREERNSVVCVSMQTYFVTNHLLLYSHNHSSCLWTGLTNTKLSQ